MQVIAHGEIALGATMLESGLGLTCMEWPDVVIYSNCPIPDFLPRKDIKKKVTNTHAFYHRCYLEKNGKNHRTFRAIYFFAFLFVKKLQKLIFKEHKDNYEKTI